MSNLKVEEYGCLGLGRIELEELIAKGYGVSFRGDKMFQKLMVVKVVHICEYTKTDELTLSIGEFHGCELYLNKSIKKEKKLEDQISLTPSLFS